MEKRGDLFQMEAGAVFTKNKLRSELFVITKNFNWEILTKNLVPFKR